jgi:hypothetical protein
MRRTLRQKIRRFRKGVSNLRYYFKVIWKDEDFDYMYIENILLKKYKRMYEHMNSDFCMKSVDQDEYNQSLRICINILQRRKDNWYTDVWSYNYGKHLKMNFVPIEDSTNVSIEFEKTKPEEMNEDYSSPNRYTDLVEERDWNIYCSIVKKYHRHWWD